jgi:hypothetical protein
LDNSSFNLRITANFYNRFNFIIPPCPLEGLPRQSVPAAAFGLGLPSPVAVVVMVLVLFGAKYVIVAIVVVPQPVCQGNQCHVGGKAGSNKGGVEIGCLVPKTRPDKLRKHQDRLTIINHEVLPLPPPLNVLAVLVLVQHVVHIAVVAVVPVVVQGQVKGAGQAAGPGRLEQRQGLPALLLGLLGHREQGG